MDRLDVMRLFVRVVEAASFSKAAKAEGVVQPTVSKQIAALEAGSARSSCGGPRAGSASPRPARCSEIRRAPDRCVRGG